ncbi:MAG TPA: hypothetical protein VFK79_16785 [Xanthobacteraceae bacterium]|nr:hypothetical protein [Xanthobacteraceae bacterium]
MQDNPKLSPLVRVFAAVVILVLAGGVLLLLYPALISHRWPWRLTPFNARFLGAFYTAELAAILMLGVINRWSPGRLILIMAVSFTALVSIVSLWHLDRFDFGRKGPWGWFFVYVGSALVAAAFVWTHRALEHPGRPLASPASRLFFIAQAVAIGGYGLALLVAPQWAAGFWPWRVDVFHAQVYSAIFITAGLGAYLLARAASSYELVAFGLAQMILGAAAILGLWLANLERPALAWTAPATMVWIAMFAALGVVGAVNLALARRTAD